MKATELRRLHNLNGGPISIKAIISRARRRELMTEIFNKHFGPLQTQEDDRACPDGYLIDPTYDGLPSFLRILEEFEHEEDFEKRKLIVGATKENRNN